LNTASVLLRLLRESNNPNWDFPQYAALCKAEVHLVKNADSQILNRLDNNFLNTENKDPKPSWFAKKN
jgi:hypothetical protein